MKRPITFALLCFFIGAGISSGYAQGDAGQAGEFLRYGVGARALGMGRAFTAVSENANAIYWNPGGLHNLIQRGISLSLMYSSFFESTTYNFAGLAIPLELLVSPDQKEGFGGELRKWSIGAGYLGLVSDDFEARDEGNNVIGETFSDAQTAIFLTATRSLTIGEHRLGFGINYKMLRHELFQHEASVAAIDLGIKYHPPFYWLQVGAILQNINQPNFGFAGGGDDIIPFSARVGVAIQPQTGTPALDALLFSIDAIPLPPGKRDPDWFIGLEYNVSRIVYAVPVKVRIGANSRETLTFGLNLDLSGNALLRAANQMLPILDWAFLPDQEHELGSLPKRFSMEFTFTPLTSERWYLRGREKFKAGQYFLAEEDLQKAVEAKNPDRTGHSLSALLRLGDLEFLQAENKYVGLQKALSYYSRATAAEPVRNEVDPELNHTSYHNFLQALYLQRRFDDVIRYTSIDRVWQHHQTNADEDPIVLALKSWALYVQGQKENARQTAARAKEAPLCRFLLGLLAMEDGNYEEAQKEFGSLTRTGSAGIPNDLIASPFRDQSLLDDAQLLFVYSKVKAGRGSNPSSDIPGELAMIQRFFPGSDVDRFLQSGGNFDRLFVQDGSIDLATFETIVSRYLESLRTGSVSVDALVQR